MYRKIVWCYIIILTLLDISLNTQLTAQGKSHGAGISVHDSLVEGITFSEWGKDTPVHGGGAGGEEGGAGGSGARAPVRLEPAALVFGARALGSAHAATVTLTNTGNTTLHLASVAGTTPDFHASFFDSKTLPPDGNTTFSVVYLGRREGPVSAHLYIHTALGVHKYSVSAEGVASEFGVWPLLGLRVPANASLQPVLTLRNPTDRPVQVSEVYSSGGWVRLSLPMGGASAGKEAWLIPPHSSRPIVRLSISPPHHTHAATAYVRIKANITGGGLIVGVEARGAPPGEYTAPLQLRLRARGHHDPKDTFSISVGSSASAGARLDASVLGARCGTAPAPAPASAPTAPANMNAHTHNGVKYEGASVSVLRSHLDPYQELTHAAELTLDYEKLWAGYLSSSADTENGSSNGGGGSGGSTVGGVGAWCSGTVRLGRAALPYSVRLLPGTLLLLPAEMDFITADSEQATKEVELKATNEFLIGINIQHIEIPDEVREHFHIAGWSPVVVPPATTLALVRLKLKTDDPTLRLDSKLVIHTNVSDYTVPLKVYNGRLELEWDWPNSQHGNLAVGAVGTSMTRRISLTVRNPAPRALCVTGARAALPGASLAFKYQLQHNSNAARCIEAGGSATAVLTLVAPARAGPLVGSVSISTPHATTTSAVTLSAHAGRLTAQTLHLRDIAPYSWSSAAVVIESTMSLRMRVLGAWPPPPPAADPALLYLPPPPPTPPGAEQGDGGDAGDAHIAQGRNTVGFVEYRPEKLCEPNCYTGLDPDTPEGAEWLSNGALYASERAEALKRDMALLAKRQELYQPTTRNISLYLRTDQVVQIPITGWVRLRWPRLVPGGAGWAGLAGVGGVATVRVAVRNPSHSHAMLLQPVLGPPTHVPPRVWEGAESPVCAREECTYSLDAFSLDDWRALRGSAALWQGGDTVQREEDEDSTGEEEEERRKVHQLPILKLEPAAEVELKISFTPKEPSALTAFLYLRNNLTIVEGVQVAGRGAYPSFELAGRRPGNVAPLVLEVSECGAAGIVRRTLAARNTGLVPVRLRAWRLAGALCANRGFALAPCQPLTLLPNQSAPLTLTFTPDYTLARATASLELTTPRATLVFQLLALTPPRVLAKCLPLAPRPPWEPPLRAAGALLAIALLALVLAAAALDAERLLRRARAARAASEPRAPLDLRAVAAAPCPAPPRPPPPRRRKTRKVDPQAESRAFERWRASLRPHDDDDSRSSEDADERNTSGEKLHTDTAPLVDSAYEPEETAPISAYEPIMSHARGSSGDDDAHSSGSESLSPHEHDDDDGAEADAQGEPTTPADTAEPSETSRPEAAATPSSALASRAARRRSPDARRAERRAGEQRARTNGKHHTRKDKPSKRRERQPPTPPRASPPAPEQRAASGGGAGGAGGAGAVRWGASWSSVVARSTAPPQTSTLPPIGSDVRRRTDDSSERAREGAGDAPRSPPSDNSLFYFNGEPEFAWRPRSDHHAVRDYLEEPMGTSVGSVGGVGGVGNSYGSIGPVWGSSLEARAPGAAWPWPSYNNNSGAVRPPPGFGTTPPGPVGSAPGGGVGAVGGVGGPGAIGTPPGGAGGARVVRPFDPFHSLAAIWSRNALDWRNDENEHR